MTGSGSHPEQPKVSQRVTSTTGGNPASHAREISNEPLEWDFFLAYASADRSRAESLYAALSTNHRVFLDAHAVHPGDEWPRAISRALAATRLTIILISANSEEAHYLRDEIATAIQLAHKDAKRRRVIPVFLDGFPSNVTSVPYGLGSIQGLDARKLGMEGIAVELRKAAARQGAGSGLEHSQVNQVVTSTAVGDAVSQAPETSSPAQDENRTPDNSHLEKVRESEFREAVAQPLTGVFTEKDVQAQARGYSKASLQRYANPVRQRPPWHWVPATIFLSTVGITTYSVLTRPSFSPSQLGVGSLPSESVTDITLRPESSSGQEEQILAGQVWSETNQPLSNATVSVFLEGNLTTTKTDVSGLFRLQVRAQAQVSVKFTAWKEGYLLYEGTATLGNTNIAPILREDKP